MQDAKLLTKTIGNVNRPTMTHPLPAHLLWLFLTLAISAAASLHLGLTVYDPATVLGALRGGDETEASLIIATLRVPRTLIAMTTGAALALSGLLMQTVTRNPLAEPGLLGINAGAAFAVTIGVTLFGMSGLFAIGLLALCGAVAATALVFGIALSVGPAAAPANTLLAGVTVAAMLGSLTQVMLLIDETAMESLLFWLMGGFADRGIGPLWIGVPVLTLGLAGTLLLAPALDALRLDDDSARSIGVHVAATRLAALGLGALLAAGAVAMAGPVVFLGLVAPHLARRICGPTPSVASHALLACLLGATLAVLADIVARLIVAPGEAPIGAVLALIGVPVLVALLRKRAEVAL
ncbi:iron complex transport system permease protein [Poseidonocella pacifica]|uniref:Iron complex transport system permease protein n=1 Tax=Poseidonocella pacifica TaxID=871651 RepID=A0A1I0YKJ1_9RHOB|nr:iron complex transport system permease protein [Poseidonocella pacifica]